MRICNMPCASWYLYLLPPKHNPVSHLTSAILVAWDWDQDTKPKLININMQQNIKRFIEVDLSSFKKWSYINRIKYYLAVYLSITNKSH